MKVVAVSISRAKGVKKENVPFSRLIVNHGLEDDAHAGDWHRQVSLLAQESIDKMKAEGLDLAPGDFAENITTQGLDLTGLKIGTRVRIGPEAVLELTQIGKECHSGCAILKAVGKCVMPTEGVFFKVITPGKVRPGDEIVIL
ncbi:MAG: MOSC domain-containing protein [Deltaproteobacteria bacterium]|nr:MOSC domain-containing protein [Deltaproteobacteria bacterium]MBW2086737.1 MOSC domain-containing protein [Deltaproteobacteria bacterium]